MCATLWLEILGFLELDSRCDIEVNVEEGAMIDCECMPVISECARLPMLDVRVEGGMGARSELPEVGLRPSCSTCLQSSSCSMWASAMWVSSNDPVPILGTMGAAESRSDEPSVVAGAVALDGR